MSDDHDKRCDYNNAALCARALLHDFPVYCTCGVDEALQHLARNDRKIARMFPLCTGTTQLAPSNQQCRRCGRYGQRCDSTAAFADKRKDDKP